MIYVGIDPGKSGAIAMIDDVHDEYHFWDMPTVKASGSSKREYDVPRMIDILAASHPISDIGECLVTLEKQQAMPPSVQGRTQGVATSFQVGVGYGLWLGILAALKLPHKLVAPVSWKKKLLADMPKGKETSVIVAKQLFPLAASQITLKKHEARAEALLIAHFGRLTAGHTITT